MSLSEESEFTGHKRSGDGKVTATEIRYSNSNSKRNNEMQVDKIPGDMIRINAMQRAQGVVAPDAAVEAVPVVRGADAVQISDAGLALASDGADSRVDSSLDPRRADQIRSNILSGAYDTLEVADQVARAVMRSGDL
jgi:hypothetical protein